MRRMIAERFPDVRVYFQAADILRQVLNFGLSAPIDAQISGPNLDLDYQIARRLEAAMRAIPVATDVRFEHLLDYPTIQVAVDRVKDMQLGLDQRTVATNLLTSLNSNVLLQPNFWLDPITGVKYQVLEQVPQHMLDSMQALGSTPLTGVGSDHTASPTQLLSNVATLSQTVESAVVNHYDIQRVMDVDCGVEGRDLGGASLAVRASIHSLGHLPPGMRIKIRGQSQAIHESFSALELGIVLAIILVYLLLDANFQPCLDPVVIISALPGHPPPLLRFFTLTR